MVGHAVFGSWRERVKNVLNPKINNIDKKLNFNYLCYTWSKLVVFVNKVLKVQFDLKNVYTKLKFKKNSPNTF